MATEPASVANDQNLYQDVGDIVANQTYTLSLTAGYPTANEKADFLFGLYTTDGSGGTDPSVQLAVKNQEDVPMAQGDTQAVSLTWDSTDLSFAGQPLFVYLRADHASGDGTVGRVIFDDVSLTMVPEPASLALLAWVVWPC